MDRSDNRTSDSPSTGMAMARALLSAAVFGAIGAMLGSWLGHRGSAPENAVAKPIMKWGMGGFWALVAAYSSLKSSEQERLEHGKYTPENYQPSRVEMEQADHVPVTSVDATSAITDGKTVPQIPAVSRV